jgi:PTH1 family peptidyl-tRNA hydrolase
MQLIVALGNPGEKYQLTRHNAGFMAVDALANNFGEGWQLNKKFNAEIIKRTDAILAKPLTMMNNSGMAAQAIMSYYNLLPKKLGLLKAKDSDLSEILTVIHDDIDIELGKYKVTLGSGSAGHKGVRSIINHLKTKNFKRIRIGIRTALTEKMPAEKFVLSRFSAEEQKVINNIIEEIIAKEFK